VSVERALSCADSNLEAAVERLAAWVAVPSISADPAKAEECTQAAAWLAAELRPMGFDVEIAETPGHPVLFARLPRAGVRKVVFYGHYDVQPAEPLEAWNTPPFTMTAVEHPQRGRLLAGRGTSDDKGQVMTFVEACRAVLETEGVLPVDLTLVVEGEEEIGSPNLPGFLRERLADRGVDMAIACDTDMAGPDIPGITVSMRGLVHDEVVIRCASHDLHSGVYGGAARNPLHVVSRIVASLHDVDGKVAIPGFYDGADTQAQIAHDDDGSFLPAVGLSTSSGGTEVPALRQTLFWPSVDVNGIWGGHSGAGSKTVIPSEAGFKVSFRLVPGQDPNIVRGQFRHFVESQLPPDCAVTFGPSTPGSVAMRVGEDSDAIRLASTALQDEWGEPTRMIATGGTIPAVAEIKHALGLDTLMIGFSHHEDMQHGPNENFELRSFYKGIRSWVRLLSALAGMGRASLG